LILNPQFGFRLRYAELAALSSRKPCAARATQTAQKSKEPRMKRPIQVTSRRQWLKQTALLTAAMGAMGTMGVSPTLFAQPAWPNKPIKIIVPFTAGGATDVVARLLGEKLSASLGQAMVIDNRGGAGGILGTDAVAKAAPDGYTFALSLSTSLLINQFLYDKLPYNPQRDLTLVSQIALGPVTLAVHPSVPAKNATELLQYIKTQKGKLSYGSWGQGSYAHLAGAYMSRQQDADMSHVPYKGEAPMLLDLLSGQIQIAFASALGSKQHADAGKLRLIGVTGEERMSTLPDLPTFAEQGVKDDAYRIVGWFGMAAPAKTPPEIVQRMAKELAAAMALPEVRAKIVAMGFLPVAGTPEAFAAAYKRDMPSWEALVKASGAKLD
jgi:tripartite-type tricarboxylate transporter receptor subunit TctC